MSKIARHYIGIMGDDEGLYVTCNGVPIAKRGLPDTPQADTWISIYLGYSVVDVDGGIDVFYEPVTAQ